MMNSTILELEQQDIDLQLQEIQLKRRQLEIERERLNQKEVVGFKASLKIKRNCYLHYSNYVKDNHMKIADVCPDGSILIHHGNNSCTVSKKYSMKSLSWIKQKLPYWVNSQREGTNFWAKLAGKYSRKFLPNGETISHTTMEKLCFLVDSGKADVWFEKYDHLKGKGKQSTLDY